MRLTTQPSGEQACVLVLGMFDGVHRGHQALLAAGRALADEWGLPLCVCTFEPHPLAILKPDAAPPLLTTVPERARLMSSWGVDIFWVHPFTAEVAASPPEDFLDGLMTTVHPAALVCGFNFRFGDRGRGTPELIQTWGERHGLSTCVVPEICIDGETVSSTRIRGLLNHGDVREAARLLASHYALMGDVLHPRAIHEEPSLRTANVRIPQGKVIPASGVYACSLDLASGDTYHAAVFVPERGRILQVHVLDAWLNLSGKRVRLNFIERLRDRLAFESRQDAAAHILTDAERTRALFRRLSCF